MPLDLSRFKYDSNDTPDPSVPLRRPEIQSIPGEITPILRPNLLLVFTGFNPGIESGKTGHHYAHRSNRFWKFLHESGLTEEQLTPDQDVAMPDTYRYGFTDLVARSTKGINQLSKQERLEGAASLEQRLLKHKPKYVAFVGKGIWETVCEYKGWSLKNFQYGLQDHIFGTNVVVLPSSSGLVSIPKQDQLVWWGKLKELVDAGRAAEEGLLKYEPKSDDEFPPAVIEYSNEPIESAVTESFSVVLGEDQGRPGWDEPKSEELSLLESPRKKVKTEVKAEL